MIAENVTWFNLSRELEFLNSELVAGTYRLITTFFTITSESSQGIVRSLTDIFDVSNEPECFEKSSKLIR